MRTVRAEVGNRWTTLGFGFPAEIEEFFKYRPKNYYWMPAYRRKKWDGYISLMNGCQVPSGLFVANRRAIEADLKIRFNIKDVRLPVRFRKIDLSQPLAGVELWDHQIACLEMMEKRATIGGLVLNATGSGKTLIAGVHFRKLIGGGVFVTDELTLLDQAREEISDVVEEEVGIIGDQMFEPRRITVATIQSLHKHRERPDFQQWAGILDQMILDEIHVHLSKRTVQTIRALQPLGIFGLTATLQMDKEYISIPAQGICGPICYRYPYEQGREEQKLSRGVLMAVDLVRGCYGSIGEPGDWNYRELTPQESYRNFIVDDKERNDCICSLAREAVRRGLPTAIIVRQVPHVRKLRMMLRDLRVAAIFGQVKRKQRTRAKVAMDSGNLDVIICNKVFTKGINIKRLSVVIDAASNRDPSDAQQKFGRGVRLYEGKLGLIYIDVGDRRPPRGENIFQASTNARRKAIESLSVYKIRSVWDGRPDLIFDKAELYLKTSSV